MTTNSKFKIKTIKSTKNFNEYIDVNLTKNSHYSYKIPYEYHKKYALTVIKFPDFPSLFIMHGKKTTYLYFFQYASVPNFPF